MFCSAQPFELDRVCPERQRDRCALRAVPHLLASVCRLDGKHVVFGSVVEGMDVIKAVERYGSQSGSTSGKITVSDCGQL